MLYFPFRVRTRLTAILERFLNAGLFLDSRILKHRPGIKTLRDPVATDTSGLRSVPQLPR